MSLVEELRTKKSRDNRELLDRAADRIEGLERKQSEWISVEDRLPDTDNENSHTFDVLVYIPKREGCRQHGIYLGKLRYTKASDGSDNFWGIPTEASEWTVWAWSYFEHPVVTHWMPLPEAPKTTT